MSLLEINFIKKKSVTRDVQQILFILCIHFLIFNFSQSILKIINLKVINYNLISKPLEIKNLKNRRIIILQVFQKKFVFGFIRNPKWFW